MQINGFFRKKMEDNVWKIKKRISKKSIAKQEEIKERNDCPNGSE